MMRKGIIAAIASVAMMQAVNATIYTASTAAEVMENAKRLAAPGDSLILKAGTYTFGKEDRVIIRGAGAQGNRFYFGTRGSDRAILDFSAHAYPVANSSYQGINLYANWVHVKGIDVIKAGDNGMLIENEKVCANNNPEFKWDDTYSGGSYNLIENCNFYDNRDGGLQMKNGCAYDTVVNCDSYNNYDPDTDGGNADGFSPKMNPGPGIYFYGCRAWNNSDDGWDSYIKKDGKRAVCPETITITTDYSICYANGVTGGKALGNGNGFKMSSADGTNNFIARHCVSYKNNGGSSGNKGFDANNGTGKMTMINCSAAENGGAEYNMKTSQGIYINCNSIGSGTKEIIGGTATTCDWTGAAGDFANMDVSNLTAPRNADGSLSAKTLSFMAPKSGDTKYVDKGTNQSGVEYSGSKADIGWIEVGLALPSRGPLVETGVKDMSISRQQISATRFITEYSMLKDGVAKFDLTCLPSGKLDVAVFDIVGKKVIDISNNFSAANKSQIVDMSKLAKGTYVCNFTFSSFDGVRTDNLKLVKD